MDWLGQIQDYLKKHEEDQFRLLKELVLQPSFSGHKEGLDKLGGLICAQLESCSMTVEVVAESEAGDQLIFRSKACGSGKKAILLVGHMDTVFPLDSSFNWYKEEGEKVFGPGVIDMKGGLVTAIFALKALHHCGLLGDIPVTFVCNSDEEIGSLNSGAIIRAEAQKCLFAMVFECGGLGGEIVTGRKGKTGYRLEVTGRAGHAAFAGADKASAILELAHKTIALEQLNEPEKEIVVNVGLVAGGVGANSIAETAMADIDTRFLYQSDSETTAERIRRIVDECRVAGTCADLTETSFRLPMEQNAQNSELFHLIELQANSLGLTVKEELRSGVSDANTIAEFGVPVIDGMGPVGDCDHSDREYMLKESLPAKTELTAVSIVSCWQYYTEKEGK